MKALLRKALTKTVRIRKRELELPPSEHIVYLVSFAVYALIGLMALQIFHMICFRSWNSEIFNVISGLIGTVTGVFLSQRA